MNNFTWADVELPVLQAIREAEVKGIDPMRNVYEALPDLGHTLLHDTVVNLEAAGFVDAHVMTSGAGNRMLAGVGKLTEKGRRAIGQWPSDDLAAALLQLINQKIEQALDPQARSRWEKLRDAFESIGIGTGSALLAQFVGSLPHMPH